MKNRLATLLASALTAAVIVLPLPLAAQVNSTPFIATPFTGAVPGQTPFFQGVPANATIPFVVPQLCTPRPLQTDVDPNLRQIRITFDQAMDVALFFWPLPTNDPLFPTVTAAPFWTNGNRTVVLPVILSPGRTYSIPINTPTLVFRGATGLYANPGLFRFDTRTSAQGGSVSVGRSPTVPLVRQTVVPVTAPRVGAQQQPARQNSVPAGNIGATQRQTPSAGMHRQNIRQSNSPPQSTRATPTPTPTPARRMR